MTSLKNFPEPLFYAASDLIVVSNSLRPDRVQHQWEEGELAYEGDLVTVTGKDISIRVANVLGRSGVNLQAGLPHGLSIRAHTRRDGDLLAYLERYSHSQHFNGILGAYEATLKEIRHEIKSLKGPTKAHGKARGRLSALLSYML